MWLMRRDGYRSGLRTGADRTITYTLALLVVAVVVPTALLLLFATVAMRNEQLAARQQLVDFYRHELRKEHEALVATLDDWRARLAKLATIKDPATQFAAALHATDFEAALVFDQAGRIVYPRAPRATDVTLDEDSVARWARLQAVYWLATLGCLADPSQLLSPAEQGALYQAQIGQLLRRGDHAAAMRLVEAGCIEGDRRHAIDSAGRSLAVSVCMLLLECLPDDDPCRDDRHQVQEWLAALSRDYGQPMTAAQRRLLLRDFRQYDDRAAQRLLHGEELASTLCTVVTRPARDEPQWLRLQGHNYLLVPAVEGSLVAVASADFVAQQLAKRSDRASSGVAIPMRLTQPGVPAEDSTSLLSEPLSGWLDGWRLSIDEASTRMLASQSRQRLLLYGWTTALAVLAVGAIGGWTSLALRRQYRLAQLKNDLLSTVSHELKTPVAAIRVLVETLLDRECAPGELREYLTLIGRENLRLDRMVQSFLQFGRIQRQQLQLQFAGVRLSDVIDESIQAVGDPLRSPDCKLNVVGVDALPLMSVDRDALVTLLVNLLDNALKYTPSDKHIEIRAEQNDKQVVLSVSDNGPGIPPAAAHRLFEPFYQANRSLNRSSEGFGLGLSIARAIAEEHGGTLRAATRREGGSVFTLTLPLNRGLAGNPNHGATQEPACARV